MAEAKIDPADLSPSKLNQFEQTAADIPNSTGKFWRITNPEGAVSHLWGTMHSTDPLILNLPPQVEKTIKNARVIAPEMDFTHPTRAAIVKQYAYEGWILPNIPAPRVMETENTGIPAHIITRFRDRTEGLGWGRDAPDYLTFGGLASLMLSDPCDDFNIPVLPIQDDRIQMLGLISGAKVMGLENPNDFIAHLNAPKNRATALSLLMVYGAYLQPGGRATSFALYDRGQIGVMMAWEAEFMRTELGVDGPKHLARTDAYLLDARNHGFLANALPELNKGGVFIAVGTYHLPGQNGMVALLRQAGFTVTRVPLPAEVETP